jgi:hypothetical protein
MSWEKNGLEQLGIDGLLERVREDLQDLPRHQWDHYLWDLCAELVRHGQAPVATEDGVETSTALNSANLGASSLDPRRAEPAVCSSEQRLPSISTG